MCFRLSSSSAQPGSRLPWAAERSFSTEAHQHARDAARAQCCAEEQGRGDRMAERLFRAEDLTPEGCEAVVRAAHVDLAAYRACLASHRPDALLEGDMNDARASGVSGLPTLYVGRERFEALAAEAQADEFAREIVNGFAANVGEVEAATTDWNLLRTGRADWLRDKKVNLLFHTGLKPLTEAPALVSVRDTLRDALAGIREQGASAEDISRLKQLDELAKILKPLQAPEAREALDAIKAIRAEAGPITK